eukprot:Sspe_Gene.119765::Locus_116596_Transcript_1_1_Confidence_1.000_Length_394::g.119765::m.119765
MTRRGEHREGGESSSVQVYVRVRPFNAREKASGTMKAVVKMDKSACTLLDPSSFETKHSFGFDGCLWSIPPDETKTASPSSTAPYCDQSDVYKRCGVTMVW